MTGPGTVIICVVVYVGMMIVGDFAPDRRTSRTAYRWASIAALVALAVVVTAIYDLIYISI